MKNSGEDLYKNGVSVFDDFAQGQRLPITRKQLHNELLLRLREFIISGQIEDGAKIPEKELCDHFGISRTPLREALKVMAFEGLVLLTHNRGATVKPLTLHDLKEVFPIYCHFEVLAGELACERLSRAELAEMFDLQERMVVLFEKGQLTQLVAIDDSIHTRIQTASENRMLIKVLGFVSGRVRRARLSVRASQSRMAKALTEHERILLELEKRDPAGLACALKDHIRNSFEVFERTIPLRHSASQSNPNMTGAAVY
jgi:DNA-binding GntR family transcriptional regulator